MHLLFRRGTASSLSLTFVAILFVECPADGSYSEHPQTKAVVEGILNFQNGEFSGIVNSPLYPISIPYSSYDTSYTAVIKASTPLKDPVGPVEARFFSGHGTYPAGCTFYDCVNGRDYTSQNWGIDTQGWKIAQLQGNYRIAATGLFPT